VHIKSGILDDGDLGLVVPRTVLKEVGSTIISVGLNLGVSSNKMFGLLLQGRKLVSILPSFSNKIVGEEPIQQDLSIRVRKWMELAEGRCGFLRVELQSNQRILYALKDINEYKSFRVFLCCENSELFLESGLEVPLSGGNAVEVLLIKCLF
jgi:hypothetical protein